MKKEIDNQYSEWLKNVSKKEQIFLKNLSEAKKEELFHKKLDFGTAGIRAKRGIGPSQINKYTIAKYTKAYLLTLFEFYGEKIVKEKGILIFKDNRKDNIYFSTIIFNIAKKMGIKAYLPFNNQIETTPFLSFLIANYDFIGGINLTASHNSYEYSGMKFYDQIGKQIDQEVIDKINYFLGQEKYQFNLDDSQNDLIFLEEKYYDFYVERLLKEIGFDNHFNKYQNLKLTFTNHHGGSLNLAKIILKKMGVDFYIVKKQSDPDSNFTNSKIPNPQIQKSFDLAIEESNKNGSKLIFATDPDGDRFGVAYKKDNYWKIFSGNEISLLSLNYLLERTDLKNNNYFAVRSIVTSNFADFILNQKNVKIYKSLTGFKELFKVVKNNEDHDHKCLYVWEESNGATINMMTKDKDSFQNLILIIEMVHYYQEKNLDLVDILNSLQKKYGFFVMKQTMHKVNDQFDINKFLDKFADKKNEKLADLKIAKIVDMRKENKDFTKQNIVFIYFNDYSFICLRPSGTEPVLRIYFNIFNKDQKIANKNYHALHKYFSDYKFN
ncbi:/ pgcA / Phosphoglucomutase /:611515 Reverse [Candidatus Hepatoplasma crinochetorum]|uniref:/ pgcA / Phosphoglucomutase /:611515 Reverse n=1 Tax=Candidatus Hepatoplasma crinochetorum TaxID=295596 RepID=A0A0G7ZN55_9MOLU|nr:/ pgcA / Phosphoglucomutase /:611515 Reverse [Candidatus Hepatoplasma crinochetorum]